MKPCYVYFVRGGDKKHSPLKIGITHNLKKRIAQMQTGSPKILRLQFAIIFDDRKIAQKVEKVIHGILASKNTHGEWFTCGVKTSSILDKLAPYIADYVTKNRRSPIIYGARGLLP